MKTELTNEHAGRAVTVAGLKGKLAFECLGPGPEDCSVLISQGEGKPAQRKYVKRAGVALAEEKPQA